jgi:hypothetical protein
MGAPAEGLALPKSAENGNLSLNKVGIRWMSNNAAITVHPSRSVGARIHFRNRDACESRHGNGDAEETATAFPSARRHL